MAIVKVEDLYGTIDMMMFPNVYAKFKNDINLDGLVTIKGKLSIRDGERPTVLIDTVENWLNKKQDVKVEEEKPKTLYLKYNLQDVALHENIYRLLSEYRGNTPVIAKCSTLEKSYKLNVYVDPKPSLLDQLHAYIEDQFIKLI